MQYWLSKLAFSFIILAGVLAWEAYKLQGSGAVNSAKLTWCYLGAAALLGLGLAGIKARHRRQG